MQIKIEIKYGYNPHWSENKYSATMTMFLPKQPNGNNEVAHCYQGQFGEESITYWSGDDIGEWRKVNVCFEAESVDELDMLIENSIRDYVDLVSTNVRLVREMRNRKREFVLDLPEPI